tara:strand:- start:253 stop:393 length:141 start_codon:yes stop_codon:yes gene_type:complete
MKQKVIILAVEEAVEEGGEARKQWHSIPISTLSSAVVLRRGLSIHM